MFIIYQLIDVILLGKPFKNPMLVLIEPALQIVGDADIHDLVGGVGENVDIEIVVWHSVWNNGLEAGAFPFVS